MPLDEVLQFSEDFSRAGGEIQASIVRLALVFRLIEIKSSHLLYIG